MRGSTTFFLVCVLVATAPLAARRGQNPTPSAAQRPTFRSSVTLVAVDVTVLDDDGKPVQGLTPDDFQIKLNGKIQPVRTMNFVEVARKRADLVMTELPAVTGRDVATNNALVGEQKVFVLAIDDLSFPAIAGKSMFTAAQRFVDRVPEGAYVGLMTTTGTPVVNPTLDREAVRTALKKVVGNFVDPRRPNTPDDPTVSISEAVDIVDYGDNAALNSMLARECNGQYTQDASHADLGASRCATSAQGKARLIAAQMRSQTAAQIAAIKAAIQAMKSAPGLKQLIVMSEGIGTTRETAAVLEPIGRAAAEAGVQLSVLMEPANELDMSDSGRPRAGDGASSGGDTGMSNRVREDSRMFQSALQTMADISGGTFQAVVGNADRAFDRAAVAGSAVYRLGVEAPADASADKAITVAASVKKDHVVVHANRQAVLPGPAATATTAEQLKAAINEGQAFYSVPVRVAVARRRASSGQVELGIGLDVPASTPGPLNMTFGLIDSAGALRSGSKPLPTPAPGSDYRLTFPMPVTPGDYHVRFAVTDAAGNIGSVDTTIKAALLPMGATMTASDVLTWWTDGTGKAQFLALDVVPPGVNTLGAGLELYPKPGTLFPNDVKVKLALVPQAGGAPVVERETTPLIGPDLMRAEVELPMTSVPAGVYVLRASVSAEGKTIGEATAIIRKK